MDNFITRSKAGRRDMSYPYHLIAPKSISEHRKSLAEHQGRTIRNSRQLYENQYKLANTKIRFGKNQISKHKIDSGSGFMDYPMNRRSRDMESPLSSSSSKFKVTSSVQKSGDYHILKNAPAYEFWPDIDHLPHKLISLTPSNHMMNPQASNRVNYLTHAHQLASARFVPDHNGSSERLYANMKAKHAKIYGNRHSNIGKNYRYPIGIYNNLDSTGETKNIHGVGTSRKYELDREDTDESSIDTRIDSTKLRDLYYVDSPKYPPGNLDRLYSDALLVYVKDFNQFLGN